MKKRFAIVILPPGGVKKVLVRSLINISSLAVRVPANVSALPEGKIPARDSAFWHILKSVDSRFASYSSTSSSVKKVLVRL